MTDQLLFDVLRHVAHTFRWEKPYERQIAKSLEIEEGVAAEALRYHLLQRHIVDSGYELVMTIGGKRWLTNLS